MIDFYLIISVKLSYCIGEEWFGLFVRISAGYFLEWWCHLLMISRFLPAFDRRMVFACIYFRGYSALRKAWLLAIEGADFRARKRLLFSYFLENRLVTLFRLGPQGLQVLKLIGCLIVILGGLLITLDVFVVQLLVIWNRVLISAAQMLLLQVRFLGRRKVTTLILIGVIQLSKLFKSQFLFFALA